MASFIKACRANVEFASHVSAIVRGARRFTCKSAAVASTVLSSRRTTSILRGIPRAPAALLHASSVVCVSASADNNVELQLKVAGMVCDGCSGRVLEALQKMPGVKGVEVNLETGLATVQLEAETQIDAFNALPQLIETVKDLGFEAEPHFD